MIEVKGWLLAGSSVGALAHTQPAMTYLGGLPDAADYPQGTVVLWSPSAGEPPQYALVCVRLPVLPGAW